MMRFRLPTALTLDGVLLHLFLTLPIILLHVLLHPVIVADTLLAAGRFAVAVEIVAIAAIIVSVVGKEIQQPLHLNALHQRGRVHGRCRPPRRERRAAEASAKGDNNT